MKRLPVQIAAVALAVLTASCINNDYDLTKLDTTVTVLPGLTIPISVGDDQAISLSDKFINDADSHSGTDSEGTIVIGRKEDNQVTVNAPSVEEIQESMKTGKVEIEIPGTILIPCADEFSRLLPGATFFIPLKPVVEINNPTEYPMDFTATLTCGENTVKVGPYKVKGGESRIVIDYPEVETFFSPVKHNISISDMMLTCEKTDGSASFATRAEGSGQISVYGYVPMEFQAKIESGKKFTVEYQVKEEDLQKIDIAQLKEDYGFSVPVFTASADITSNIPMTISASATATVNTLKKSDRKEGPFSFDKAIAAGSISSPVTTSVSAEVSLDKDTQSFSSIVIKAECTPSEGFALTTDHILSYSNLKIVFTEGVTINPGK